MFHFFLKSHLNFSHKAQGLFHFDMKIVALSLVALSLGTASCDRSSSSDDGKNTGQGQNEDFDSSMKGSFTVSEEVAEYDPTLESCTERAEGVTVDPLLAAGNVYESEDRWQMTNGSFYGGIDKVEIRHSEPLKLIYRTLELAGDPKLWFETT